MLARWPSKQDCKEDMGELIASLCTKCSVSDLRAHKNGKITSDIRTWISLCGVWQCRGPRVPLPGQREEIKEVTWGNLLWYRGLNWKLCFLSWIHISSWRAPAIILLAFPGGYRSYLLDRCVYQRFKASKTYGLPCSFVCFSRDIHWKDEAAIWLIHIRI